MKEEEIRVNKETGKVEICSEISYINGIEERRWEDYDTMLLRSTLGKCSHSDEFYPLLEFKEAFEETKAEMEAEGKTIKIRYAYLGSPTNLHLDPAYHEVIGFKVLTIVELETRLERATMKELLTGGEEVLIRILGRDRSTGLKDMEGEEIFESDIIRWYPNRPKNHIDNTVEYTGNLFWLGDWYENDYPDTAQYCKVIGNIYKNNKN